MSSLLKISICDTIEGFHCVDGDDAEKIYAILDEALAAGTRVELSFAQLQLVVTAFLNTAIGKLCAKYPAEKIRSEILFTDTTQTDRALIERVIENAVKFYANAKNA
ncbi:MAG: STAS-like domain-containing protein [Opitutales bacterium]|nr:STAS-like domain-containing protein [Opitutales bacterium]